MDQLIGSTFYIAPEVWSEEYDTSACDIWSFGIILYSLITKEFPFDSKKEEKIKKKIMKKKIKFKQFDSKYEPLK